MRLALSLIALPLLVVGCAAPATDSGELAGIYEDAAAQYDVPRDLLVALSYGVTRFDAREGQPNKENGYGVMNLVEHMEGPDMELAASLLAVDSELIKGDDATNVLAGAALLRHHADLRVSATGEELEDISDWFPVVAEFSGLSDPLMRVSYAQQTYRFIEGGLEAEAPGGEVLKVRSREVYLDDSDSMLFATGTDYSGAAHYVGAHSSNYSNYSRGGGDIDRIVIHTVQGSYAGCVSWFGNSSANSSAHYVVRSSDGEVTQMVKEEDVAWHGGHWDTNARSIGIEHEGYVGDPGRWYTDAMYRESARLTRDIADRYGIPLDRNHIIGHFEVPGCSNPNGGGASCHTDPGSGWDWDKYMDMVRNNGSSSGNNSSAGNGNGNTNSGNGSAGNNTGGAVGDLIGYVREGDIYNTGGPIAGATVSLDSGVQATTDATGLYRFRDVERGQVQVRAEADGYGAVTETKEVQAGMTNWRSVALQPGGAANPGGGNAGDGSEAAPGKPMDISPWNYEGRSGESVTLSWSAQGPEEDYFEVEIYWWSQEDWQYYYTYWPEESEKVFWPYVDGTYYAFGVRGYNAYGVGEWSDWGSFTYSQ